MTEATDRPQPEEGRERARKREEMVQRVAAHLVNEGFSNSGVRALARAAGTSDRMLMYYFATKDELVAEALTLLAAELVSSLERLLPARRASAAQILSVLTEAGRAEEVRPLLALWFEVVGLAVRGAEPFRSTATEIVSGWEAWIRNKLRADQRDRAPALLAEVEGRLLLGLLRD
jgi:AcrR family transcriptional regulator